MKGSLLEKLNVLELKCNNNNYSNVIIIKRQ